MVSINRLRKVFFVFMRIILRLEKGSLNQKPLQKDIHRDEFLLILQIPPAAD